MKDDIKPQINNSSQFTEPGPTPSKVVDGIQPPQSQNTQNNAVQTQPSEARQAEPSQTASNQQETPALEDNKPAAQNQPPVSKKPRKNFSTLPAIMAVIVLLALSSLAVYAGIIKEDASDSKASSSNSSSNQTSESQKAEDNQAIQETLGQIDSLPEEQDSSGDGLEDSQLGL